MQKTFLTGNYWVLAAFSPVIHIYLASPPQPSLWQRCDADGRNYIPDIFGASFNWSKPNTCKAEHNNQLEPGFAPMLFWKLNQCRTGSSDFAVPNILCFWSDAYLTTTLHLWIGHPDLQHYTWTPSDQAILVMQVWMQMHWCQATAPYFSADVVKSGLLSPISLKKWRPKIFSQQSLVSFPQ